MEINTCNKSLRYAVLSTFLLLACKSKCPRQNHVFQRHWDGVVVDVVVVDDDDDDNNNNNNKLPYFVSTEYLQYYIHCKRGLFKAYNCKYPA